MYKQLIRPLLFSLDPETVHHLTLASLQALSHLGPLNPLRHTGPSDPVRIMGLDFPNRLGLAAGLDKNGTCLDGLSALGFGFLEVGTVTPLAQPGNPRPRLFRLPEAGAIINRMGFNNLGVEALVAARQRQQYKGILGINLGKTLTTSVADAGSDYRKGMHAVYDHADYITINISSPNTPGLRGLQEGGLLENLLRTITHTRDELASQSGRIVPLALKIAPDMDPSALQFVADQVITHGFDGIIATNTTLSRTGVEHLPHAGEAGGLSGCPVKSLSTATVATLADYLQGRLPIIACGGISSAEDAMEKLSAGASLVQIYTGLIYEGPALVKAILQALPGRR